MPRLAHAARVAVVAAALSSVAVAAVPAGRAAASRAPVPAPLRPPAGAAMVGWHEKGDDLDALRAHEAQLGTRFAVVRVYQQWKPPSAKIDALVGDARLVLASHKPPAGGWAAVASGAEDAAIALLADRYRAYGTEIIFSFHHEPHDDAADLKGGTAGTAADYQAAWRRIHEIFVSRGAHRSAGGNVWFAYIATGSWALAQAPGGPPGSGDPLYPGDGIVDVLAHDRYNWASCRGDDWEEFEENWAPLVALAARLGKPLIAGELGSPPAGGLRNDWFRRGAEWMRSDPLARRWMWGFAYYHSMHETCPWDFLNQGDDGALGWQDAFSDPYFTGIPFSLGSSGAVGDAPPAPAAPIATPPPATRPAPTVTTTPPRAIPAGGPGTGPGEGTTPAPATGGAIPDGATAEGVAVSTPVLPEVGDERPGATATRSDEEASSRRTGATDRRRLLDLAPWLAVALMAAWAVHRITGP